MRILVTRSCNPPCIFRGIMNTALFADITIYFRVMKSWIKLKYLHHKFNKVWMIINEEIVNKLRAS